MLLQSLELTVLASALTRAQRSTALRPGKQQRQAGSVMEPPHMELTGHYFLPLLLGLCCEFYLPSKLPVQPEGAGLLIPLSGSAQAAQTTTRTQKNLQMRLKTEPL